MAHSNPTFDHADQEARFNATREKLAKDIEGDLLGYGEQVLTWADTIRAQGAPDHIVKTLELGGLAMTIGVGVRELRRSG